VAEVAGLGVGARAVEVVQRDLGGEAIDRRCIGDGRSDAARADDRQLGQRR
jgi:hypothetical protein